MCLSCFAKVMILLDFFCGVTIGSIVDGDIVELCKNACIDKIVE